MSWVGGYVCLNFFLLKILANCSRFNFLLTYFSAIVHQYEERKKYRIKQSSIGSGRHGNCNYEKCKFLSFFFYVYVCT